MGLVRGRGSPRSCASSTGAAAGAAVVLQQVAATWAELAAAQPDDLQAKRFAHGAAAAARDNTVPVPLAPRRLIPAAWRPDPADAVAWPVTGDLMEGSQRSPAGTAAGQSPQHAAEGGGGDGAAVQQQRLRDLIAEAQGYTGADELPSTFTDLAGVEWHRSALLLGKGATAEVWQGMGEDGALVALKALPLPTRRPRRSTGAADGYTIRQTRLLEALEQARDGAGDVLSGLVGQRGDTEEMSQKDDDASPAPDPFASQELAPDPFATQ